MGRKTLKKIDFVIIAYAVALCFGAMLLFDTRIFFSVFVGSIIAFVNWLVSRWLGIRLAMAGNNWKMAIILGFKTVFILGVIGLVLTVTSVDPIAFMIGLSALVLGILSNGAIEVIAEGHKTLREER